MTIRFSEWQPEYDSPEAQETAALRHARDGIDPKLIIVRLMLCFPRDIEGVTLNRIRALLMPGPHEIPPEPYE